MTTGECPKDLTGSQREKGSKRSTLKKKILCGAEQQARGGITASSPADVLGGSSISYVDLGHQLNPSKLLRTDNTGTVKSVRTENTHSINRTKREAVFGQSTVMQTACRRKERQSAKIGACSPRESTCGVCFHLCVLVGEGENLEKRQGAVVRSN